MGRAEAAAGSFDREIENCLLELTGLGIKPGLERIRRLLEAMGNPQDQIKAVHIAGTNGKGSTAYIVASVLRNAGYKVGSFTSPHLHSYLERITVNGEPISSQTLLAYLRTIKNIADTMEAEGFEHPTEFEVLTAAAFKYFCDEQVDIVILEVGMGGRFDSTNVVTPLVAAITRVELDHMDYLGQAVTEIAYNKAGIIKPDSDIVTGAVNPEALAVIESECKRLKAKLWEATEHVSVSAAGPRSLRGQHLDIGTPWLDLGEIFFSLPGEYQIENLKVAIMVISLLRLKGWNLPEEAIRNALGGLQWPGRLETIHFDPLVIVDAAHNPDGARALNESLQALVPGCRKILVCGIVDNKDARSILRNLSGFSRLCIITRPEGERSRDWRQKTALAREFFSVVIEEESITGALEKAIDFCGKDDYILVTGSFYVLGRVRQYFTRT